MLDLMPQSRRGGVNTKQYTVRGPNSVPLVAALREAKSCGQSSASLTTNPYCTGDATGLRAQQGSGRSIPDHQKAQIERSLIGLSP